VLSIWFKDQHEFEKILQIEENDKIKISNLYLYIWKMYVGKPQINLTLVGRLSYKLKGKPHK
jgi:hypothetical protein